MLGKPLVKLKVVILLGPEHTGKRLAHDPALIIAQRRRGDVFIECIRLLQTLAEDFFKALAEQLHFLFQGVCFF